MIDIHTHILPGVDDGAKSMEKTIELLKEGEKNGVTGIIATPHYLKGYYLVNRETTLKKIQEIEEQMKVQNISIKIYPGNEIYISHDMMNFIKENKVSTLNNSKYVLIEWPVHHKLNDLEQLMFQLIAIGLVPIIAHPERYQYVQEDPNILRNIIESGALVQGTFGALIGSFHKKTKNTLQKLLESNMVHFMASDIHTDKQYYSNIQKCIKELKKYVEEDTVNTLLTINPNKIILDEEIEIGQIKKIKTKNIFWF